MPLPVFRSQRKSRKDQEKVSEPREGNSERTLTPSGQRLAYTPGVDIKKATRVRKTFVWISTFFFLLSVIFLILVSEDKTLTAHA